MVWNPNVGEFGHWMVLRDEDGEELEVWVTHCGYHTDQPKPCRICEAAPLSLAEGAEA